jgi:hypothetical protein
VLFTEQNGPRAAALLPHPCPRLRRASLNIPAGEGKWASRLVGTAPLQNESGTARRAPTLSLLSKFARWRHIAGREIPTRGLKPTLRAAGSPLPQRARAQ